MSQDEDAVSIKKTKTYSSKKLLDEEDDEEIKI